MDQITLFAFEQDFAGTLRCIPMAVRLKLDQVGIKLSLRQWSRLTSPQRHNLLISPCASAADQDAYRATLARAIEGRPGETLRTLPVESAPAWQDAGRVASQVQQAMAAEGFVPLAPERWASLTPLERFVLLKLSAAGHDNVNFVPALKEFALLPPDPPAC